MTQWVNSFVGHNTTSG